jgi:hypothetical protein
LSDASGGSVALDNVSRLRERAILGRTADQGRLDAQTRKENRYAREYQALVPFQQVEFYAKRGGTRDALFVACHSLWKETWTL